MKISFNDFLNEKIINKPTIFNKTIYRLPTIEELIEVNEFNLSSDEILSGFKYTIIGRGIKDIENKKLIIESIKLLCNLFPNNENYKKALKKSYLL
jgi:hypothetical protein